MKISDIQDRTDLKLVTDSQSVKHICEFIGKEKYSLGYGFFVCYLDGDIKEVFAFEGCIPYIDKMLSKIY